MHIDLKPVATLDDNERAALKVLTAAVYPPEFVAVSPGRHLQWAPPDHSVLVFTPEGELVSHIGIVIRMSTLDGTAVKIGGIGSVKTHPQAQGRGYASAGLRRAATALHDNHRVAFSLLVCQEHLLPFYSRLGWLPFAGRLLVEQPTGSTVFTINHPMVLAGLRAAPQDGLIDLKDMVKNNFPDCLSCRTLVMKEIPGQRGRQGRVCSRGHRQDEAILRVAVRQGSTSLVLLRYFYGILDTYGNISCCTPEKVKELYPL